jgi:mono/diheme cytochrome c family protein
MPRTIWLISVCAMLCAGCDRRVEPRREWRPEDHAQPAEVDPARTAAPVEAEEGGVDRAADALYTVSCAGCHGRDGRGQGEQRPPGAQMPDFTAQEFQGKRKDAELAAVIRDGRGMMPGFGKQLNAQGLEALVAKVRRFAKP